MSHVSRRLEFGIILPTGMSGKSEELKEAFISFYFVPSYRKEGTAPFRLHVSQKDFSTTIPMTVEDVLRLHDQMDLSSCQMNAENKKEES